jgi:hypothetical protein
MEASTTKEKWKQASPKKKIARDTWPEKQLHAIFKALLLRVYY